MVEPKSYRNNWRRAIITVVHLSCAKEKIARIVEVKNRSGTIYQIDVSKLIVIDFKKSNSFCWNPKLGGTFYILISSC